MSVETARPAKKTLGLWTSTSLVVGNMIGSGVFLLPASLAVYGGISVFGWLFTASGAMILAYVFASLSREVPGTGGPYIYTRIGFGDLPGFLVAWGYWISIIAGNAAIAVAFIGYAGVFWPPLSSIPVLSALGSVTAIWVLTWVNSKGVREAGIVQLVTTLLKILPLLLVGFFGLFHFDFSHFTPLNPSGQSNLSAFSATAALTLWAFLGLESATIPAEEVQDSRRTIPRATLFGTGLAALVYVISTVAVMGLIPSPELARSTAPFAQAASQMWGSWAGYFVAAGAAISCLGALNGWILLQGQIPFAAARDHLFPRSFSRLSGRRTPVFGLVVSSVFVTVLLGLNHTRGLVELFTFTILLGTLTTLLPYVFCTMAYLMILLRKPDSKRGELIRPAVIGGLGFIYSLWAIAGAGQEVVYWGLLLLLAGIPVFVWIQHRR